MKNFTIFESSILGFFAGSIVSTYISFVLSTDRYLGNILNWVSLRPILELLPAEYKNSIIFSFLFFILIFVIYGIIIGLILKKGVKTKIFTILLIFLILIGIIWEQNKTKNIKTPEPQVFANYNSQFKENKKIKQYFGNETIGDLNFDGKDDVVFYIKRNDEDGNGDRYYLTASLQSNDGYLGTNLIYLDYDVEPKELKIENNIISIKYENTNETQEDEILENIFYFQIIDGKLKKIEKPKIEEEKTEIIDESIIENM